MGGSFVAVRLAEKSNDILSMRARCASSLAGQLTSPNRSVARPQTRLGCRRLLMPHRRVMLKANLDRTLSWCQHGEQPMRLRQLRLYNYRSFGDATVDLEDVTLLTGPNNAGKSMLLDAVRCLLSDPAEHGPDQKNWDPSDLAPREPVRLSHGFELSNLGWGGPVRIVGIFDSLLEDERLRYQRFLVSGCLQLGVWMESGREGRVLGETRYFVLPDGHEAAAGPVGRRASMFARDWNAILLEQQHEVWRPYCEDTTPPLARSAGARRGGTGCGAGVRRTSPSSSS